MRPALTTLFFALLIGFATRAQSPTDPGASAASGASSSGVAVRPTDTQQSSASPSSIVPEDTAIILKHRPNTPDTPQPKSDDERRTCPAGNGKPCAVLGGRVYYSDALGLSQHNKSWSSAATSASMLLAMGLLTAATVADIETTQSCIHAGTCKEGNPLMGQSRAQAYSVSMSVNAIAFWAAAEQKRHGHGAVPFFILWGATAMHATMAAHNAGLNSK
jgi:hypothetical protein